MYKKIIAYIIWIWLIVVWTYWTINLYNIIVKWYQSQWKIISYTSVKEKKGNSSYISKHTPTVEYDCNWRKYTQKWPPMQFKWFKEWKTTDIFCKWNQLLFKYNIWTYAHLFFIFIWLMITLALINWGRFWFISISID